MNQTAPEPSTAPDFPNDPHHPLAGYKAGPPSIRADGSTFIRYDCVVAWSGNDDQESGVLNVWPDGRTVWDSAEWNKNPPDKVIGHRRITPLFNAVTGEATDDPDDISPPDPPKRPTPPDFAGYVRFALPFAREMVDGEWPDADRREAVRLTDFVVGGLPEGWSSMQKAELARGRGATALAQHTALFAITHSTATRVVVFCGSRNEAEDAAHGLIVETREAVNAGLHRFNTNPRVLNVSVPTVAVDDGDHPETIVFAWNGDDCRFALGSDRADLLICDRARPKDEETWGLLTDTEIPTIEFVTPQASSLTADERAELDELREQGRDRKFARMREANAEIIAEAAKADAQQSAPN